MSKLHALQVRMTVVFALALPQLALAQLQIGDEAPPLLGRTRSGESVSLADRYGRVQAVTFWASWCGPCLNELPLLEKLQRALGPDKLRVVAVNIEDRIVFRDATRQMHDWQITLSNDQHKEAYKTYRGQAIPYLLIISKDGKIRQVFRGYAENSVREIVTAVANAANE